MTIDSDCPKSAPLAPEMCWQAHEKWDATPCFFSKVPGLATPALTIGLFWNIFVNSRAFVRQKTPIREIFWRSSFSELTLLRMFGANVETEGMDHLKALNGQPAVIIGNHMSMLETLIMPCMILPWLETTFIVKESLLKTPFMGTILKSVKAIGVGRANPRDDLKAVLEEGQKALKEGRSVVIFPQSTRSETFDIGGFNSIGIKLAKMAKVPVIPLALRTDFLQNGKKIKELGRINPARPPIHFAFGEKLEVSGNGKEAQDAVIAFICAQMEKWNVPIIRPAQDN